MKEKSVPGSRIMTTAAFMIVFGIAAFAQGGLGGLYYQAELPLVIGDAFDPFQYDGLNVRELDGTASLDVDPDSNEGVLIAELRTTEVSGPIVISETQQLEGTIRVVMDEFYGLEPFKSGGISEELLLHGDTGVMTDLMPEVLADLVGWGLLDIYLDGELIYEDLEGHFMITERVRRRLEGDFSIFRSSDEVIYSSDLEDKTGFAYAVDKELHVWASGSEGEDVLLHLNLLLQEEVAGFGGEAPPPLGPPAEEPPVEEPPAEEPPVKENPNAGPKGNNGIGNGLDPQPPGNPPPNDEEGSTPGGGKKK